MPSSEAETTPGQLVAMRYSQGDLAILSAETYDPGLSIRRTTQQPTVPKRSQASGSSSAARRSEAGSRKRTKVEASEGEAKEDDEKKRARGRPRLDIKDETAADRRRTQIRLAQRAYRNRKENAIQSLEKKVQELKDTNEEMSNAFMRLHDFAVNSGLLDHVPDFGRQLRATTEKFLTLARRSNEEAGREETEPSAGLDHDSSDSNSSGHGPKQRVQSKPKSPERPERLASSNLVGAPAPSTAQPLFQGIVVTHEPVDQDELEAALSGAIHQSAATNTDLGYEIVTHPTLENASFPFETIPNLDFGSFTTPTPICPSPSEPRTYAGHESTFGRRLHRMAAETALRLVMTPNPPPDAYARIFGFCLMVESREAIQRRFMRVLERNTNENLHYWTFPFHHLGGAGTHFEEHSDANIAASSAATEPPSRHHRMGNQDTVDILKPRNSTGFAIGPFTEQVSEVRDQAMDREMRVWIQQFRGEFFDTDEVEIYLHQRGVSIPPGADYAQAEIDPSQFENTTEPEDPNMLGAEQRHHSGGGVLSSPQQFYAGSSPSVSGSQNFHNRPSQQQPPPQIPPPQGGGDPSSWNMQSADSPFLDPRLTGSFSTQPGESNSLFTPDFGMQDSGNFGQQQQQHRLQQTIQPPINNNTSLLVNKSRRTVHIDVNLLLLRLLERAVCLGRTPGIRPRDVNTAFMSSVQYTS